MVALAEQNFIAERDLLPVQPDARVFALIRLEIALFVELCIVGQVALGDEGEHLSARHRRRAVVQHARKAHGNADEHEHALALGRRRDVGERRKAAVQKHVLPEQVAAGVAADAQFGKDEQFRARLFRFLDELNDIAAVIMHVRHADFRRGGGGFDKAVFHSVLLPEPLIRRVPRRHPPRRGRVPPSSACTPNGFSVRSPPPFRGWLSANRASFRGPGRSFHPHRRTTSRSYR